MFVVLVFAALVAGEPEADPALVYSAGYPYTTTVLLG